MAREARHQRADATRTTEGRAHTAEPLLYFDQFFSHQSIQSIEITLEPLSKSGSAIASIALSLSPDIRRGIFMLASN